MSANVGYYGSMVTRGLVLYLDSARKDSYEGVGTTWSNLVRGGLPVTGSTVGGPPFVRDDGGVFDFNGSSHTITISHNTTLSLSTTSQRTMQAWVKFDTLPTTNNRMIVFGKLSSAFSFDGYWAGLNFDGKVVCATNGGAISKTSLSTSTISIGVWYLFTFISQITSTSDTTKVYINDTEYISTFHGSDSYSESNNFTLGYFTPPLAGLGLGAYLDGELATLAFYDRGLSQSEVIQNYTSQKGRFGL